MSSKCGRAGAKLYNCKKLFQNSSKWKEIAKQGSWSTIKWPKSAKFMKMCCHIT